MGMSSVGHIVKGGFSKFFFQFLSDGLGSFWTKHISHPTTKIEKRNKKGKDKKERKKKIMNE
jgi:hypothetical protein